MIIQFLNFPKLILRILFQTEHRNLGEIALEFLPLILQDFDEDQ